MFLVKINFVAKIIGFSKKLVLLIFFSAIFFLCFWYVCNYHINVVYEHVYRYCKQNYTEKFADNEDKVCPEQVFHLVEQADDKIVENKVE